MRHKIIFSLVSRLHSSASAILSIQKTNKKLKVFLILLFLTSLTLSINLFSVSSVSSCLTSSEDYAAEVVLNSYNLFNLRKIVSSENNKFILPTQYDPKILTIIQETDFPQGLSVRLQIPTEATEIKKPHLKLVSASASGTLKENLLPSFTFNKWKISCQENECKLEKDEFIINIKKIANNQEVTLEINKELKQCSDSCSGICFSATIESKCLERKDKTAIDTILRYTNVSNNFEELLDSYRIIGSEEVIIQDIKPQISPYINWQEAMRQELVFLTANQVLELKRDEIESIVFLAKRGQAGQNYRIVYDFKNNSWIYYDKTSAPVLTSQRDCNTYSQIRIEEKEGKIKTFYLVPLITLSAALILLLMLAIIAKTITSKRKRKMPQRRQ
ncbi:MAG: hypothetical protein IIA87_01370 [Nanoarchaeota archaeon]|nr:hypothetical protein [Nanoarchaeota archaeon]